MNVKHLMGVIHSFSIKNIFYDKMDVRFFYFDVAEFLSGIKRVEFHPGMKFSLKENLLLSMKT